MYHMMYDEYSIILCYANVMLQDGMIIFGYLPQGETCMTFEKWGSAKLKPQQREVYLAVKTSV